MKNFRDYFLGLSTEERDLFAARAETSSRYILGHLINRDPDKRKHPRPDFMHRLVAAAGGALEYEDLVKFFYVDGAQGVNSAA